MYQLASTKVFNYLWKICNFVISLHLEPCKEYKIVLIKEKKEKDHNIVLELEKTEKFYK